MSEALTTRPLVLTFVPGGNHPRIQSYTFTENFSRFHRVVMLVGRDPDATYAHHKLEETDGRNGRTNVRTDAVTEKLLKSM